MSEKLKDGGPAYPTTLRDERAGVQHGTPHPGMSQRDWFAGMALIGLISNSQGVPSDYMRANANEAERLAQIAFCISDAMLSARQNKEKVE